MYFASSIGSTYLVLHNIIVGPGYHAQADIRRTAQNERVEATDSVYCCVSIEFFETLK